MQGTGEGGLCVGLFSGPRSLIPPAVRVRKDQKKDGKSMWMMADVTGWRLAVKGGFGPFFFLLRLCPSSGILLSSLPAALLFF